MRTLVRAGGVGLAVLACGWLLVGGRGRAGEDAKEKAAVQKIADAVAKGDQAGAEGQAKALAKSVEDIGDIMNFMKPRKKGGFGVGPKPGAITPDGIEQMLISMGRDGRSQAKLGKEAKAIEEMAYRAAAIMTVALAKTPEQDQGTKTRKLWTDSAKQAREGLLELAKAARDVSGAEVKAAASRANTGCNNCHSEFR
jgi:hypothetical protein